MGICFRWKGCTNKEEGIAMTVKRIKHLLRRKHRIYYTSHSSFMPKGNRFIVKDALWREGTYPVIKIWPLPSYSWEAIWVTFNPKRDTFKISLSRRRN
jgi:hypothetical protein